MSSTPSPRKVILITGASSGMGRATAERLLRDGHIVYGAARRVDAMQGIVRAGGVALALDLTDRDSMADVVKRVIAEQGRIDVLVNNAGYSVAGAVEDVSYEDAKRQFEVNLFGLAELTKAVLPHMRAQQRGTIINTTSVGGKIHTPLGAWYHATKHALEGWSDCLRLELAPHHIDVVILEPGGVASEFGDVMTKPLRERARGGAYEAFSNEVAAFYESVDGQGRSSPPSVIADTVATILSARRPKTRYAAGFGAKPVLFMRRWLSDRLFDKLMLSTYRVKKA